MLFWVSESPKRITFGKLTTGEFDELEKPGVEVVEEVEGDENAPPPL